MQALVFKSKYPLSITLHNLYTVLESNFLSYTVVEEYLSVAYIEEGLRNSKDGAASESDAALWYYILLSGVIVLLTVVLHRFWYMKYRGMAYHDITLFIHIEQHLPAFI